MQGFHPGPALCYLLDTLTPAPLALQVLANPSAFDVAVTTYDMMHSADLGKALCRTIHWRYLILDEGHKIKNEHTLVSQSMRHTR